MLFDQISEDIKSAMKARDKVRLETLRNIKKVFLEAKTAPGANDTLEDADALKIIAKLAKQGKETAKTYADAGRQDLADAELAQVEVIEGYLPKQLSEEEIEAEVKQIIAQVGATSMKEMGRVMGEYIASQLHGKGRVMEIMGLEGSSPAIERHNGFAEALKRFPNIEVVATLQGDWTEESAVKAVKAYQGDLSNIDFVFGQNDRMAMGARKTLSALNSELSTKFCGIDGLPGEDGGIRLVRDSILDASYIYPTHGDQIIELAVNILEGKPSEKETLLMSALVTRDNARVLLMQNEEMMRQSDYLDQLHHRADNYLDELDTQHLINWMSLGVIALLLIIMVLFYLYHLKKIAIQRERVVNTLWNMKPEDIPQAAAPEEPESHEEPTEDEPVTASLFITRFKEAVEKRLDESELSVEDLAADMNLSRVQLYRKVKSYTGSTPVELVRTARLNRGYQLLLTTDKSVSEVAYQVGFSAPSYFTKCFKEEYGLLPGDLRK